MNISTVIFIIKIMTIALCHLISTHISINDEHFVISNHAARLLDVDLTTVLCDDLDY